GKTCPSSWYCRSAQGDHRWARERSGQIRNVVQPQKAALENVLALRVLAVEPPGKVEQQLMEDALQEHAIREAGLLAVDFVDLPCCPGMNRWVDIVKRPFKSRELAIGMHVPLPQQQVDLTLGKRAIDQG